MAHPCFLCGSECYCHGDIDDVIVSKTPKNCEGCGCVDFAEDQGWNEDDHSRDWDEHDEPNPPLNPPTKNKINGY